MDAAFFDAVREPLFGGSLSQQEVDWLNAIGDAWQKYGDGDNRKLAYILATAKHETDHFRTLEEYASGSAYEGRSDLGNVQKGDGRKFKGRGFVQITGRRNYTDWSKRLGVDLLKEPAKAMEPEIAARILVEGCMLGTFTGKKLGDYIATNADFRNARRVVNGTDKANTIAGYANKFLDALLVAGEAESEPEKPDARTEVATLLKQALALLEK